MKLTITDGWLIDDMIIFNELDNRGWASKGFIIEPPDLKNAPNELKDEYADRIGAFIAGLRKPSRCQIQWTVDSDYSKELMRYNRETDNSGKNNRWSYFVRKQIFNYFWYRMNLRNLRREKLKVYITQPVGGDGIPAGLSGTARHEFFRKMLKSLQSVFLDFEHSLNNYLGGASTMVKAMSSEEIYSHYMEFLNPSLAMRVDYDPLVTFDPGRTLHENCFLSGINCGTDFGFYMDGFYHNIMIIDKWPSSVYSGIINTLTGIDLMDYTITVNIIPKDVKEEIKKEEHWIERLKGDYRSSAKHSLLKSLQKKEEKVNELQDGYTTPVDCDYIIRSWAVDKDELRAKTTAIRNAVNSMKGANCWEPNVPATVKKIFFTTWPGWTFSSYRKHSKYCNDHFLARMLPFTATFTGNLDRAEAIYAGNEKNITGSCDMIGGTPQHAFINGMSGGGKSVFMMYNLSQTAIYYDFTAMIEEGNSYGSYTLAQGTKPIIFHPDSDIVINYLDTNGLPLSSEQISNAVFICENMCGEVSDKERGQIRQAMIQNYIETLYDHYFDDWSRRYPAKMLEAAKYAICVEDYRKSNMPAGTTFIEAFIEYRDLINKGDDGFPDSERERFSSVSEEAVSRFCGNTETEKIVRNCAYAWFNTEEYPTHSALVELMDVFDIGKHKRDDVRFLSTLLSAWTAFGANGRLFDGSTNISMNERHYQFELGRLGASSEKLKALASMTVNNFVRNRIMTMPRKCRKLYVFEEAGRIMKIPGGDVIMEESYEQMRKFNTTVYSIIQQYTKYNNTAIKSAIFGNTRQYFLLKQTYIPDVEALGNDIGLTEAVKHQILHYESPEHQPASTRHSSFMYIHHGTKKPVTGTGRIYASPELLYIAETDGDNYDRKVREMQRIGDGDIIEAIKINANNKQGNNHA